MAYYAISIDNKSGSKRSYGVFAENPTIDRAGSDKPPKITARIITSVQQVASDQGQATFILSKTLYATCGIYDIESEPAQTQTGAKHIGTGTEVIDQREVTLGRKEGGKIVPGTLLEIECADGIPAFAKTPPGPGAPGGEGCFAIQTKGGFTNQEAKLSRSPFGNSLSSLSRHVVFSILLSMASNNDIQDKFVVGFSSSLRQNVGPYATFVPGPNESYQIKPSTVFYIAVGKFSPRDIITEQVKSQPGTCRIDFGQLETNQVSIIHNDQNKLDPQVPVTGPSERVVAEALFMAAPPSIADADVTLDSSFSDEGTPTLTSDDDFTDRSNHPEEL
ncbi:hypothetical protein IL306_006292 [Fusarium sp. DS 682]|nr:hypothetical protein IL306_006292 [Fusarium sp. DS 682]